MADKNLMGYSGYAGYDNAGFDPEQQKVKLAKQLAALQDAELAYDMIDTEMPGGQVVNGVYLPPAWTQQLAAAVRRNDGRNRLDDRASKAGLLIDNMYGTKPKPKPSYFPDDTPGGYSWD